MTIAKKLYIKNSLYFFGCRKGTLAEFLGVTPSLRFGCRRDTFEAKYTTGPSGFQFYALTSNTVLEILEDDHFPGRKLLKKQGPSKDRKLPQNLMWTQISKSASGDSTVPIFPSARGIL